MLVRSSAIGPLVLQKADDLRRVDHLRYGEPQTEKDAGNKSGEYGGHHSNPHHVTQEEARDDRCRHERSGRNDGARREPSQPANAMSARAATAKARTEADQQPARDDDQRRH